MNDWDIDEEYLSPGEGRMPVRIIEFDPEYPDSAQRYAEFKRGGKVNAPLSKMAHDVRGAGRHGDSILIHINPDEFSQLKADWGDPLINPDTGIPEWGFFKKVKKKLKKAIKKVAKTAAPFAGLAALIGGGPLMAAGVGAGLTALGGGNMKKMLTNAALGAGGAYGIDKLGYAGAGANWFGGGAGAGNALAGIGAAGNAAPSAVSGLTSELLPATSKLLSVAPAAGSAATTVPFAAGSSLAGNAAGSLSTAGKSLLDAGMSTAKWGLPESLASASEPLAKTAGKSLLGDDFLKYGMLAGLGGSALTGSPENASVPTTDVPEDFNRELSSWDMNKIAQEAAAAGMTVNEYVAKNLGNLYQQQPVAMADGGEVPPQYIQASNNTENDIVFQGGLMQNPLYLKYLEDQKAAALAPPPVPAAAPAPAKPAPSFGGPSPTQYVDPIKLAEYAKSMPWHSPNVTGTIDPRLQQRFGLPLGQLSTVQRILQANADAKMRRAADKEWEKKLPPPITAAKGGPLSQLARGAGSGRSDQIKAVLSDGEYVMDAESVALLGDGSPNEGAKRLDHLRNKVRQHKGKALAKGKISPNAKSPLAYIKGAR